MSRDNQSNMAKKLSGMAEAELEKLRNLHTKALKVCNALSIMEEISQEKQPSSKRDTSEEPEKLYRRIVQESGCQEQNETKELSAEKILAHYRRTIQSRSTSQPQTFEQQNKYHYLIFYPYKQIRLSTTKTFTIGRDTQNDLILPSYDVSRLHATIAWDGQGYLLHDTGSTNGSFVNSRPVSQHCLKNGDLLLIGNNTLYYQCQNEPLKQLDSLQQEARRDTQKMGILRLSLAEDSRIFRGDLRYINIWQILQMLSFEKNSGCLTVNGGSPPYQARIYLHEGRLLHCRSGDRQDQEIFFEILYWQDGYFEFDVQAVPPEITIDESLEYLLLEGARRIDERNTRPIR